MNPPMEPGGVSVCLQGKLTCSYCLLTSTSCTTFTHGHHGVNQPLAPKVPRGAVILILSQSFFHLHLGLVEHWRVPERCT